jgi:ubiquinone/menaquinone biosynthesis C-methylase UbiE
MRVKTTEVMRRDWDERAKKNAFHYIASWRKEWDLNSFLSSGEEDFQRFVLPVLERCKIPPFGKAMVELGCGAGRMTTNFARRYERVLALDLSIEMLQRARQVHSKQRNILWLRASGTDLACLANDSADFVFSYLVLQHLPNEDLVFAYVREILRILKPGGAFLFQFNGSDSPTMNLRGRIAWGIVDTLWSAKLAWLSHAVASLFGLDPAAAGKTWRGAAIAANRVGDIVQSSRGEILEMSGVNTPMTWCCGVKVASA